jgi:hypothetical protein
MRILAIVVASLVSAAAARGQGGQCMYGGQVFASGAVSCQEGKQQKCVAGSWRPNGLDCAVAPADSDEPLLRVDPGRGAPAVREPNVGQPAAPAAPKN